MNSPVYVDKYEDSFPKNSKLASIPISLQPVYSNIPLQPKTVFRLLTHKDIKFQKNLYNLNDIIQNAYLKKGEHIFIITEIERDFLECLKWQKQDNFEGIVVYANINIDLPPRKSARIWHYTTNRSRFSRNSFLSCKTVEKYPYILELPTFKPTVISTIPSPSFDREACSPPLDNNSCAVVKPEQDVELIIKNFRKGLILQLSPGVRKINLDGSVISFRLPGSCIPGFTMSVLLVKDTTVCDKISYVFVRTDAELITETQQYPYKPLYVDDSYYNRTLHLDNYSVSSISPPLLSRYLSCKSLLYSTKNEIPRYSKQLPQVAIPRNIIKKHPTYSQISQNIGNFDISKEMKSKLVGIANVHVLIRTKRRGNWQSTSINPSKIGKMRKIEISLHYLTRTIFFKVTSSSPESIIISPGGKSSSNKTCDTFGGYVKPDSSNISMFSFYLMPTRIRKLTKIRIEANFVPMVESLSTPVSIEPFLLIEWDILVAGHKYESSKSGRYASEQNIKRKLIPLFDPYPNNNQISMNAPILEEEEEDIKLVNSLIKNITENSILEKQLINKEEKNIKEKLESPLTVISPIPIVNTNTKLISNNNDNNNILNKLPSLPDIENEYITSDTEEEEDNEERLYTPMEILNKA